MFSPSENILYAMMDVLEGFYHDEALTALSDDVLSARPNSREAIAVREYLRRQIRFLQNYSGNMADVQKHLILLARFLMTQIPLHALTGSAEDGFSVPYLFRPFAKCCRNGGNDNRFQL